VPERFLMTGHKLPLTRWYIQELCREAIQAGNPAWVRTCGVAARPWFKGDLTPIEWDATMLYRLLKTAEGTDEVESVLAARDIAKLIEAHAHEIVFFMGMFPGDLADRIFRMPAKAAIAKRTALIGWEITGEMPELARRWAEKDPSILDEFEAAGAPVLGPPKDSPSVVGDQEYGSRRTATALAAFAVIGMALLAWR
jgi:hypothetical protein